MAKRYLVVRVPSSGPPALAGAPNDFATLAEAETRVAEITAGHRKAHHTHLEIVPYTGDKAAFLKASGTLA